MRVFQNFRGRRRVFLGVFDGLFGGIGKSSKKGFLRVFWEILGSQSLAGDALYGTTRWEPLRIKDHGPCFGTNEHPRRDTDVILRLSKAPIEIFNSR